MAALRKFTDTLGSAGGLAPQDVQIDWSNPITKGMSFATLLNGYSVWDIVGAGRDILNNFQVPVPLSLTQTPVIVPSANILAMTPWGPGITFGATDVGKIDFGIQQPISGGPASFANGPDKFDFTILVIANPSSSAAGDTAALFSQRQQSGFPQIDIFCNSNSSNTVSAGNIALYHQGLAAIDTVGGPFAGIACNGQYHVYVARAANFGTGAVPSIWVDGVLGNAGTAAAGISLTTSQKFCIGGLADAAIDQYAARCTIVTVMVWSRGLGADEIVSISFDPFQVFAPEEFDLPGLRTVGAAPTGPPLMGQVWC